MSEDRFTCLALDATTDLRVDALDKPSELGHGYRLDRPTRDLDFKSWQAHVGEQKLADIRKCNAWIWVEGHDSVARRTRLGYFETALQITRAPLTHGSWIIEGTVENEVPRVSSFGSRRRTFIKEPAFPLTTATLKQAANVAKSLEAMFEAKLLRGRLDRGFVSLVLALRIEYIEDSILYLMRALEGMLHADSSKQFQSRAARIWNEPNLELLRELYHVRNKFTHAEPVELAFPNRTAAEATQRARQLQAFLYHFATRVYRKIIGSPELLATLSQTTVGELWGNVVSGHQPPPLIVSVDKSLWNFVHELEHYLVEPVQEEEELQN